MNRRNFGVPSATPRVANPNVAGLGYQNSSVIFDSFSVAAAAAFPGVTTMFQVQVGSAGKTLAQTNLRASGMLENGDVFYIGAFGISLTSNTFPTDAVNILENVSVQLIIGGRTYVSGAVKLFPGGIGGNVTAAANLGTLLGATSIITGFSNGAKGIGAPAMFTFSDPVVINANETIQVVITAETGFNMAAAAAGGTGTTLTCVMFGSRIRKVA